MNGFQKFLRVVDRRQKTDFLFYQLFWLRPFFNPLDLKKDRKMAGAKKVFRIINQFFHAHQPRKGILEIRSHWCCIFTIFWPGLLKASPLFEELDVSIENRYV